MVTTLSTRLRTASETGSEPILEVDFRLDWSDGGERGVVLRARYKEEAELSTYLQKRD
jgi:hypothetical protein